MTNDNSAVEEFWPALVTATGIDGTYTGCGFGNDPEMADSLGRLFRDGPKPRIHEPLIVLRGLRLAPGFAFPFRRQADARCPSRSQRGRGEPTQRKEAAIRHASHASIGLRSGDLSCHLRDT